MRNVEDKFLEKIETHFKFNHFFFRKSCRILPNVGK